MWPDVHWETPGPAFEQNTMLLLSDSMDRLISDFMDTFPFIQLLALSLNFASHSITSDLILQYSNLSLIDLTLLLSRSGGIGFRCIADVD